VCSTAYAMYDQYLRLSRMKKALIILLVLLPLCLSGQMVRSSVTYAISTEGESLGDEEITNGDFTTNIDYWEAGTNVSVSGGELVVANSGAWGLIAAQGNDYMGISLDLTDGNTYRVTFDVTNYSSGNFFVTLGGTQNLDDIISAAGSYSMDIVVGSGTQINFTAYDGSPTLHIDNISVREVL
jgi:uncharacterized ubiquitin-like protein YukD